MLNATEKLLFFNVIAPSKETSPETQKKTKRKNVLPPDFSEEILYAKIITSNNAKVPRRLKKLEEIKKHQRDKKYLSNSNSQPYD